MTNNQNNNQGRGGNNVNNETRNKAGTTSPGNFKNDPERASEAGKKGGQSRGGRTTQE